MSIKYKVKKHLVLPILKLNVDCPAHVQFLEPINAKEKQEKNSKGEIEKGEIHIAHVIDLDTGLEHHCVMGHVLLSTLYKEYPDDTYVNKFFQITKLAKRGTGAKSYHPYLLSELDVEDCESEEDESAENESVESEPPF